MEELVGKWPLERLLDEFELLHYDLSEIAARFFPPPSRWDLPPLDRCIKKSPAI
jgi:hypothetical protein